MAKSQFSIGSRVEVINGGLSKHYPLGLQGTVEDDNYNGSSSKACYVAFDNAKCEWFFDGYLKLVTETKEKFYPSYV